MIGFIIDVAGVILISYVAFMIGALGYSEVGGRAKAHREELAELWRENPEVARSRGRLQRLVDWIAARIAR